MATLTSDQKELLDALADAQSKVPKGGYKQFMTASAFSGVNIVLADGVTQLPLDTTDLDQLVESGFVRIDGRLADGDVAGVVTPKGLAFVREHRIQTGPATTAPTAMHSTSSKRASVFYSWQSDIKPSAACRSLIEDALGLAVKAIASDDSVGIEPVIDRDVQDVPGSPDIGATIFAKIERCSAFVADVSFVGTSGAGKPTPNPNVLIELGYALHALGPSRIIMVLNRATGRPEDLPFDLRQKLTVVFDSPLDAPERAAERRSLAGKLEGALRTVLTMTNRKHHGLELGLRSVLISTDERFDHYDLVASISNTGTKRLDDWELELAFPTALVEPNIHFMVKDAGRSNAERSTFRVDREHFGAALRPGQRRDLTIQYRLPKDPERRQVAMPEMVIVSAFIDAELAAATQSTVADSLPSSSQAELLRGQ
jgi:hypothetical protein